MRPPEQEKFTARGGRLEHFRPRPCGARVTILTSARTQLRRGLPMACSADCARVLLPFQDDCASVLADPDNRAVSSTIGNAANLCSGGGH